jgi:regulator of sigma E protease
MGILNFALSASFAEVMSTIWYFVVALLFLLLMVVIHELGHYVAGKKLGFKITEFGIGFGPPIYKRVSKKTGEIFTIRPIPLGGFCNFEGEDEDNDSPTAFNKHAPWKRLVVLFSGAFMNFISALIMITLFFTFYGQLLPGVYSLYEDSYAYQNNQLMEGDIILRVDGKQMNVMDASDVSNLIKNTGDSAEFTLLRDGKIIKTRANKSNYTPKDENGDYIYDENGQIVTNYGYGFVSSIGPVKLNFFLALSRSFSFGFFVVFKILASLAGLITGSIGISAAGGPLTVINIMADATRTGFAMIAYIVLIISANLAVMNLLPLPALDGSRMLFVIIEWIRGKPINPRIEGIIHFIGFLLLIGFALFADLNQLIFSKL